jgi:hypothetical protein
VAAGVVATTDAVLTALQTFLDYASRAAEHWSAGAACGKLRRAFDAYFPELRTASDRSGSLERLNELRVRINELGESSPLISPRPYKAALKEVGKGCAKSLEGHWDVAAIVGDRSALSELLRL